MGLRDRIPDTGRFTTAVLERTASSAAAQRVGDGLRGIAGDDGEITPERLLVSLVDAVHADDPPDGRTARDVYKSAVKRRRRLGVASLAAGPLAGVANQLVDLYCEVAVVSDVSDSHRLGLTDEEIAAHVLVMWSIAPSLADARGAVDGTGDATLADLLEARIREQASERITGDSPMSKSKVVGSLWRARAVAGELREAAPDRTFGAIAFPGKRTKALIAKSELQLGVV